APAPAPAPSSNAPPAAMPPAASAPDASATPSTVNESPAQPEGLPQTNPEEPAEEAGLGPTPLPSVNIINKLIYGEDGYKDAKIKVYGWLESDYTYLSTGP